MSYLCVHCMYYTTQNMRRTLRNNMDLNMFLHSIHSVQKGDMSRLLLLKDLLHFDSCKHLPPLRAHYSNSLHFMWSLIGGYSQDRSSVPGKILLMIDYLKNESVSRPRNYCQIQISIPACAMGNEYFTRNFLYLVRLKIFESGVSISTNDQQSTSATLLREVGHFFPLNWKLQIKY